VVLTTMMADIAGELVGGPKGSSGREIVVGYSVDAAASFGNERKLALPTNDALRENYAPNPDSGIMVGPINVAASFAVQIAIGTPSYTLTRKPALSVAALAGSSLTPDVPAFIYRQYRKRRSNQGCEFLCVPTWLGHGADP
jgi:hypothetical protein